MDKITGVEIHDAAHREVVVGSLDVSYYSQKHPVVLELGPYIMPSCKNLRAYLTRQQATELVLALQEALA